MPPRNSKKRARIDIQTYSDSGSDSDTENKEITRHIHHDIRSTQAGINTSFSLTSISKSSRTAGATRHTVVPADTPATSSDPADSRIGHDNNMTMHEVPGLDQLDGNEQDPLSKKRVRQKGDPVLSQWEERCDDFVHEFIGHEGRGFWNDNSAYCVLCGNNESERHLAEYECIDCRDRELFCKGCIVTLHSKLYLHRIRRWNGNFFEKSSTRELGFRLQLGHRHGLRCARPERSFNNEFWVISVNGLHKICLDFCGCAGSPTHYIQLLRAGLFPATILHPQTAATFDVLDLFELLTYESKLSAFEFYSSIVRLTCNDNLDMPGDRYPAFVRMVHEYRHLHMIVRAGRGYDPTGVSNTSEGECAVLCPACPQKGINMDPDWEDSSKPYIHSCFLALDANFRLKRKDVSSEELDPGLSKGWAYFVENTKYRKHWLQHEMEKEPKSSCSRHDAVNLSNTKGSFGHSASGVGKVCCSRHNMTLPNSIGDLQVGESYGVGRTDGEAPERGWNETNPLAGSTREMGPGFRRDTINDHMGDHNWRRVINMDETLRRKLYTAALDMAEHHIEYQEISEMIPPETKKLWITEMDRYEHDPKQSTNPFEDVDEGPTMAAIRRELAEEEAKQLTDGRDFALHDEVSQSVFIDLGIKLEMEQRAIKNESKELWDHAQDRQKTKFQLNLNTLQRKTDGWLEFQRLYCPGVERLRKHDLESKQKLTADVPSCDFPLYLPSQIKGRIPVDPELITIEQRLRTGQAYESLARLRRELQTRAYLYNFTDQHTRGQGASTRAKNTIDAANARIAVAADDYRVAFAALESLPGAMESQRSTEKWKQNLQMLQKQDVRHISQAAAGETIGNQTISWIWKIQATNLSELDKSNPDHVKPEWWKCRARATRFAEEVDILVEEQKRTKRYFQYYSNFWHQLANTSSLSSLPTVQAEAHRAYALKKSAMFAKLVIKCDRTWAKLPNHISRMRSIMADPSIAAPGEFSKSSSSKAKIKAMRKGGLVKDVSKEPEDSEEDGG